MSSGSKSSGQFTAKEIAENLLERTGNALISGDFAAFIECFHVPHSVISMKGVNVLASPEDVELVFNDVRAFHKRLVVTELVRHSLAAEFAGLDTVKATHETRLLSGATLVEDPYPVFSVLKRIDGKWLAASSEYAVPLAAKGLISALAPKPTKPS